MGLPMQQRLPQNQNRPPTMPNLRESRPNVINEKNYSCNYLMGQNTKQFLPAVWTEEIQALKSCEEFFIKQTNLQSK